MLFLTEGIDPQFLLVFYIIFGCCLVPIFLLALVCFFRLIIKQKKKVNKAKKASKTAYLQYFGPDDNIISVSKNLTRVSVEVKDLELVNLEALKNEGIGVMITGNTIKCSSQTFADQIEG